MKITRLPSLFLGMSILLSACLQMRNDQPPDDATLLKIEIVNDNARPDEKIDVLDEFERIGDPLPAHQSNLVDIDTYLSWSSLVAEDTNVVYGVLLGAADSIPDELVCAATPAPLCDPPGSLTYNTHYYWQVFATDSEGTTQKGPIWEFTTVQDPSSPLFSDDFSFDSGWVNESHDEILRDPTREILVWESIRSEPRKFYIPINIDSNQVRLSFRLNLLAAGGNGNIFFGLAENLDGSSHAKSFPPGFFIYIGNNTEIGPQLRHYITHSSRPLETLVIPKGCGDMTCAPPAEYFKLKDWGIWYKVELIINGKQWRINLMDDAGNPINSLFGVTNNTHEHYRYLMLFNERHASWEWLSGYLDDIELYASPVSVSN